MTEILGKAVATIPELYIERRSNYMYGHRILGKEHP